MSAEKTSVHWKNSAIKEIYFLTCLCRFLSQSYDEIYTFWSSFDLFLTNFNLNQQNSSIIISNLNLKFSSLWLLWLFETRFINQNCRLQSSDKWANHVMDGISPCIDSILFSNLDLAQECKIEQSLYGNCHRYTILNMVCIKTSIHLPYHQEI